MNSFNSNYSAVQRTDFVTASSSEERSSDSQRSCSDFIKIRKAVENVISVLGYGHTEKTYQSALVIELRKHFEKVRQEQNYEILYENHIVGVVHIEIEIESRIIIKIRCFDDFKKKDVLHVQRYKKVTGIDKGFLININFEKHEVKEV